MWRGPLILGYQIPAGGPYTHTGPGALSMKVEYLQGAPPLVEPLTHTKLHMQVLGSLHGYGLACPLQSSLSAVLYNHCRGVGGVFQPWGKGLKLLYNNTVCILFCVHSYIHSVNRDNIRRQSIMKPSVSFYTGFHQERSRDYVSSWKKSTLKNLMVPPL